MEKFTASNGVEVHREDQGSLTISPRHGFMRLADDEAQALGEFFLHERDQELGRWRWPENPDYVVHTDKTPKGQPTDHTVVVIHEPSGDRMWAEPGGSSAWSGGTAKLMREAAKAYFKVFPPIPPKPWHGAKPGEVWVLSVDGSEDMVMTVHESNYGGFRFRLNDGEGTIYALDTPAIRAGRRIWPEVSDG